MDTFELKRRERWAELAASIAEADRPKSTLRFWLSWKQVVDDPVAAVPASGDNAAPTQGCAPAPGAGSGAAGSTRRTPALGSPPRLVSGSPVPGRPNIVGTGPGEPQLAPPPRASEKPGPTRHHQPCSEASRISAAPHWHQ
jgi:hypothetical protein